MKSIYGWIKRDQFEAIDKREYKLNDNEFINDTYKHGPQVGINKYSLRVVGLSTFINNFSYKDILGD